MKPLGRTTIVMSVYALALAVLTTALTPAVGEADATPQRSTAHSAFGLQLSVPSPWGVAYFQNCPTRAAGTLLIGTPAYLSYSRVHSGGCQHHFDAAPAIRDGFPRSQRAPRRARPRCHLLSGCSSLLRSNDMVCPVTACRSHGHWTWIFGHPAHADGGDLSGRSCSRDAQRERLSHRPDTDPCHRAGFDLETRLSWHRLVDDSSV